MLGCISTLLLVYYLCNDSLAVTVSKFTCTCMLSINAFYHGHTCSTMFVSYNPWSELRKSEKKIYTNF